MKDKYSNIFWHQGVRLFEEEFLKTKGGLIRIQHLENDVTKALLNVFENCDKKVLNDFLKHVGIDKPEGNFGFDFQVTDTEIYRQKNNRVMLSIIAQVTPKKSVPNYEVVKSIPDACIFNEDTAVLIEAKTQSPLIEEQIDSHIENYFGKETREKKLHGK